MASTPDAFRFAFATCALLLAAGLPARAGEASSGFLAVGVEYSDVRIGARQATWRSQLLQWERRSPAGGLFAAVEQRQRDHVADQLLHAGGFRVWEHWTLSGQLEKGL